ncbi:hypothetical protein EMMF5_002317 [Cystobasidiomycetes sp. EMM_F5]
MAAAVSSHGNEERKWWKEAIVYQVYPRSFKDSNGDGIGDIKGITSQLDHLKELGVDVLWVSPFFKSPQKDFGYDISDYLDIHEEYGNLDDVDELIRELHKRGMKLMIDGVWNHSSDQHAWFLESRSSKTNPKRDWYIWRPPKYDAQGNRKPPNNWLAVFRGESAWTWDETTQEYYLRLFVKQQPDLNWDNPKVRTAIHDVMRFWLARGVDGFRMDVIAFISKTVGLPDASIREEGYEMQPAWEHYAGQNKVHDFIQEMNREVLSKYDCITVGEVPCIQDSEKLAAFSKIDNRELQMIFTFEQMDVDSTSTSMLSYRPFLLSELKGIWNRLQVEIPEHGGWNSIYISNHDQARPVSRFGSDLPEFRDVSAKMLATFTSTLSGTLYVYQGEEIAMANVPKTWTLEDYPDPATHLYYNEVKQRRLEANPDKDPDMTDILSDLQHKARDNARTPMQWSTATNAGFSDSPNTAAKPWMRVNPDYVKYNVETERSDPNSVLSYWKKAIQFRKANLACTYGIFRQLEPENEQLFIYTKSHASQTLLVVLNFTKQEQSWQIPAECGKASRLSGNFDDASLVYGTLALRPFEAVVFGLSK